MAWTYRNDYFLLCRIGDGVKMNVTHTAESLIAFEEDIAECFNNKKIRAPVHLRSGNEEVLIDIFNQYINEDDWILTSWASHIECLLKGVPTELVKQKILDGKSISLCFPEYNILSSAIVGGITGIATGLGLSIKRQNKTNKIWCFIGDMTYFCGSAQEAIRYVNNFDLPVKFIIADNGLSVCTPTCVVWGEKDLEKEVLRHKCCLYYKYTNKWPHAGGGKRINF